MSLFFDVRKQQQQQELYNKSNSNCKQQRTSLALLLGLDDYIDEGELHPASPVHPTRQDSPPPFTNSNIIHSIKEEEEEHHQQGKEELSERVAA